MSQSHKDDGWTIARELFLIGVFGVPMYAYAGRRSVVPILLFSAVILVGNRVIKDGSGVGIFSPTLGSLPVKAQEIQRQRALKMEGERQARWAAQQEQQRGHSDWIEARRREEEEQIARGESVGERIQDQVAEVWRQGERKMEEVRAEDERVLRDRRRAQEFPSIGK